VAVTSNKNMKEITFKISYVGKNDYVLFYYMLGDN
jgi:hypothetical protein